MKVEILAVTPAMAEAWLKNNPRNRTVSEKLIKAYARDMSEGNWVLNGEAVKVSETGQLLDGQQRLAAVVLAGTTIPMVVVSGLPRQAQDTMDMGRKRSLGDVFAIHGENNYNQLAAITRRAWMWDAGNYRFTTKETPTAQELQATLEKFPSLRRSAEVATRTFVSFRPSSAASTGTAHHILNMVSESDAAEFFARFAVGADLPKDHPILTLRNRLMTDSAARKNNPFHVRVALFIRAWNALREGRELSRLVQGPNDDMPMPV